MSLEVFHGSWQIMECVNISSCRSSIPAKVEGAIFVLQENGEIKWELGAELDLTFPLFQCDCYEVVQTFVGVCIQMGAVSGHMFEFWVDRPVPRDMMLMTFEGWCMMQCQQIVGNHPPLDFPFSFLPAFTEGYFSDMKLSSVEGDKPVREFKVHSVILELSELDAKSISKFPSDVQQIVLHFIYSQSLPSSLSPELAQRCIDTVPDSMSEFVTLCKDYIHRKALKAKIVKLVNEVHSCAEAMASGFREHCITNPSRFCNVIKLSLRHAAVAFMKLVELCALYGQEADNLSRNERLEILRYAKSRLPIFLTQFVSMLRNVKNDFSTVRPSEKNDIAAHAAPEIETLLETLANLMKEARDACSEIWARWSTQPSQPRSCSSSTEKVVCLDSEGLPCDPLDSLKESLFVIFRKREVVKLHQVQVQLAAMYLYLAQKKESFEEMAEVVKVRCVSRNLEQLLEELPVFLLRLEEIMMAFDDRFQWKDFKFCLQLAISQVCQTVHHLLQEKSQLQKFFISLSEMVQRDEFRQSLINLGLLEVPTDASAKVEVAEEAMPTRAHVSKKSKGHGHHASFMSKSHHHDYNSDLNLLENPCTSRKAKSNILAKNAATLLESKKHSDMIFEIAQDGEPVEIQAHRVIVAARCDWFRRALLSGMKESIQRRIVIHDCPTSVFQLFLQFLYTGQISGGEVSLEVLSELISLADRYEMDMLKLYCEQELILRHLDETCVIFLLSMADNYNARTLRAATMEYIASNPGIMAKEMFEELSPELQMEVYDITMWSKPKKAFSIPEELLSCPRYMLVPDSPSEEDDSSSDEASASPGM